MMTFPEDSLIERGQGRDLGKAARRAAAMAVGMLVGALIVRVYGTSLETLELIVFTCALLVLSLADLDERVIPNSCILVALAARAAYLATACLLGDAGVNDVVYYFASGMGIGAAMLALTVVFDRVLGRESMGGGDIKLYAVAGAYFGWQQGLLVVVLSCIIGVATALFASACDARSGFAKDGDSALRRAIPFGPSIAVACLVVMLAGDRLLGWYAGLLA